MTILRIIKNKIKMKQISNQPKEPIGIPFPEKLPEIEPAQEPIVPKIYPEENPTENPQIEPVENPPYKLPEPDEFPLK